MRPALGGRGCGQDAGLWRCVVVAALALVLASRVVAEDPTDPVEPGDIKFVRQAAGMDDVAPATCPHWIHRRGYT